MPSTKDYSSGTIERLAHTTLVLVERGYLIVPNALLATFGAGNKPTLAADLE